MIVLMSANPRDIPTIRTVPTVPDATPRWPRPTDPIIALLLGDEKSPIPIPMSAISARISIAEDSRPKRDNRIKEMAMNPIPAEVSAREPIRSESLPAKGERIVIITG